MRADDVGKSVAHVMPPLFVFVLISTVFAVYSSLHLLPLLQLGMASPDRDKSAHDRGCLHGAVSQVLSALLVVCFVRAVLADPGRVPAGDAACVAAVLPRELKASGERRFCKGCRAQKPDRAHHCRVCERCVLKMDHHCPWIMNCIGLRNHKFFFLSVVYAVLDCYFISCTVLESVQHAASEETTPLNRFLLVLCMTLAVIMAALLTPFLSFHAWLMFRGMTTIEFCEKTSGGSSGMLFRPAASYSLGCVGNLKAVLGPHILLWFLPFCPPAGDGVRWDPRRSSDPEWADQDV